MTILKQGDELSKDTEQRYAAAAKPVGGYLITSTWAKNESEARVKLYNALSKPGRYGMREEWVKLGSHVRLNPYQ